MRKIIIIPIWITVIATIFILGFATAEVMRPSIEKIKGLENKQLGQPEDVDFSLFWDAWHLIEKRYVDRPNLDRQNMVYGAVTGLLESLDDPYSVFMEPEISERFLDDIKGSFSGIGAEIGMRKEILTIISPLEGSPAKTAGIMTGDKILKIDETLSAELTLDEAVGLIRGDAGTEVRLLILRDGWDEAKEIRIVRDTIRVPVMSWKMISDKIAYIQLFQFAETLPTEFRKASREMSAQNPQGIILDVRNNPGGYLEVAVDIASWFLPKDELVVIEDFGNEKKEKYYSRGYEMFQNIPVVVLINEGSASAAEILAGALKDARNAKLVGQKSFGKGSVQELENMENGASIKITIAKWLTPSGTNISKEGITPDEESGITEEDIQAMRDPQLDHALETLNGQL